MAHTSLAPVSVLYLGTDEAAAERIGANIERSHDAIEVATVTSPAAALAFIEANHVDCLVSAFDLDGTDGIAFLEELRGQGVSLPFILFPRTAEPAVASRAVAADVDRYRPNPAGERGERACEELAADILDVLGDRTQRVDMLDRMTDGFMALDDRWRFRYLNEQAREVICEAAGREWSVTELQGREIWEVLPAAVDTVFYEKYHQAVETQEPVTFEEQYDPLGTWFEVRAFPSPTGLSVFFYDVTDRREYQQELERREGVLQNIYRITADKGRTFDEKVSELLAIGREELDMAYGTLSRIEGEDYVFEVHAGPEGGVVDEGDVVPLEETNCERTAHTEERLVLADIAADAPELAERAGFTELGLESYLGTPVFVDDDVTGTVCFYDEEPRDEPFTNWQVTLVDLMGSWVSYERERERREAELERERNRLEKFASVVSHDLRNPLNTAQLRLGQVAEETDSEHVADVRRSLDRMDELITDVLAMARLGKQVVDPEELPAAPLIDTAWGEVGGDAAELRVDDDLGWITGDEGRLQQLFENLFANAVEHGSTSPRSQAPEDAVEHGSTSPDSQARQDAVEHGSTSLRSSPTREDAVEHAADADRVTVRVGRLTDGAGFYVEDDGPGVPEAEREEIFEWGYTTRDGGTGFGLATVEQIVDAHGATITVTDAASGGARFEVRGIPTR